MNISTNETNYLEEFTINNLIQSNMNYLFPVQTQVIPWLLKENRKLKRPRDLCVSAPTGSGKTLAYVLPIVQLLKDRVVCQVRAVIVLPVIELAVQVFKIFEHFIRGTDLKVVMLTGQKSFSTEQIALVKHGFRHTLCLADIIITTPGRLLDHIYRTPGFSLRYLKFLVIDEADRLIEEIQRGWLKQVEETVYRNCPDVACKCFTLDNSGRPFDDSTACSFSCSNRYFQKLLFSATLALNQVKMNFLTLYRVQFFICDSDKLIGKCSIPEDLVQNYIVCKAELKPMVLCHYILNSKFNKVLCFTQSVQRASRLNLLLGQLGLVKSKEISSDRSLIERKITIQHFNAGKVNVLVCSDLVARGIDFKSIDCVVSYDVPKNLTQHIHRIGRTARAFKKGKSLNLLTEGEFGQFKKMFKSLNTNSKPVRLTFDQELLCEKKFETIKKLV